MTHASGVLLRWTGNLGAGTADYTAYSRDHELMCAGKPDIRGSSDPAFRGDAARWTPEELLLGALAACHQLWYLHLCADAGIVVLDYSDAAEAEWDAQAGFVSATLRPSVHIRGDAALAQALHEDAAARCCIARSVSFPVRHQARIRAE